MESRSCTMLLNSFFVLTCAVILPTKLFSRVWGEIALFMLLCEGARQLSRVDFG